MQLEVKYLDRTFAVEVEKEAKKETPGCFTLTISNESGVLHRVPVEVISCSGDRWTLLIDGKIEDVLLFQDGSKLLVDWGDRLAPVEVYTLRDKLRREAVALEVTGKAVLRAQMPGKIVSVLVSVGDQVKAGEGLVVIEAMKMQNELKAPKAGTITACNVAEGGTVKSGDLLLEIE